MTNGRHQKTENRNCGWIRVCLLISVFCLLSCTAIRPPAPYLPQRSGVVPGQTITVGPHQNIYGIAQDNGVSMREIIVLNGLQAPYVLKPGQSLILPIKHGDAAAETGNMTTEGVAAAPIGGVQEAPMPGIESQPLPPPIPPPAPQSSNNRAGFGAAVMTAPTTAPIEALNAPAAPPTKPVPTTLAAAGVAAAPVMESATGVPPPAMIWPVQGPVLSSFGPKGQGVNNDGINIGAPKGAPVVASANGIVIYAGDEMKGFGNLVLIRHEGGWVTAYAYLDRVLVAKDAVVAQGDMIGTVGKTGNISSPQLHFEVRRDGKTIDPSGVIKKQSDAP